MTRTIHVTKEPVVLEGYQAILKPSQYGYTMSLAITDPALIERLEEERDGALEWASSKLKNKSRRVVRPEPWEELPSGGYKMKFTWNEDNCPPIVDAQGTLIKDKNLPLFSGSKVRVGFYQKPYILNDKVTIGTSLKAVSIQVVSVNSGSAVDSGPMEPDEAAALFGKIDGYRADEPNVEAIEPSSDEEQDLQF